MIQQRVNALIEKELCTKQPAQLDSEGNGIILTADGQFLAFAGLRFDTPTIARNAEQTANAERLVACWNACLGMPTLTLHSVTIVRELLMGLKYARRFLKPEDVDTNWIDGILGRFEPLTPEQQATIDAAKDLLGSANITDDNTPMYEVADLATAPAKDGWGHSANDSSPAGVLRELGAYIEGTDKHEQVFDQLALTTGQKS